MPLSKFCNAIGCNSIISTDESYCGLHVHMGNRHKDYDMNSRDRKRQSFYHSMEWIRVRKATLRYFYHMDLYDYYTNNVTTPADTVHHIVELIDNWDLRLDMRNLFPVSAANHNTIHKMYEQNKQGVQEQLAELVHRFKNEFGKSVMPVMGGVRKHFLNLKVYRVELFFRRNSPLKFLRSVYYGREKTTFRISYGKR